jgi:hypothetical protein
MSCHGHGRSPSAQPISYPVTNERYAIQIARDWNVKASDAGFVTRFVVRADYLSKFPIRTGGGSEHREYWIPAEQSGSFNENIVGLIEVIHEFGAASAVLSDDDRAGNQRQRS